MNITFSASHEETDEERMAQVVHACGLSEDLARLDDGIEYVFTLAQGSWLLMGSTKVGERGITLSGGQKQRVCIARAAYNNSDIVLLDDPLSAVDAHVGRHLLQQCILAGPLAGRTRVLVTHHLDVLPSADYILVMDSDGSMGRIVQQGTYTVRHRRLNASTY